MRWRPKREAPLRSPGILRTKLKTLNPSKVLTIDVVVTKSGGESGHLLRDFERRLADALHRPARIGAMTQRERLVPFRMNLGKYFGSSG